MNEGSVFRNHLTTLRLKRPWVGRRPDKNLPPESGRLRKLKKLIGLRGFREFGEVLGVWRAV